MTTALLNGQLVEVVSQRGKRVLITTAEGGAIRIPGKERMLQPGELCFVSRYSLEDVKQVNHAERIHNESRRME